MTSKSEAESWSFSCDDFMCFFLQIDLFEVKFYKAVQFIEEICNDNETVYCLKNGSNTFMDLFALGHLIL
jgi:hypothetical protein